MQNPLLSKLSTPTCRKCIKASVKLISLLTIAVHFTHSGFAQDIGAEPLYGTAELSAGFFPDPHVVELLAGGSDSTTDIGTNCVGFIEAGQPDYDLNYSAGSTQLGIFVDAEIDTTLLINDPRGNWHCNDDASFLSDANPGIVFNTPISGNYNIWVGTYSNDSDGGLENVKLVITEWDENQWSTLDLDQSTSNSLALEDNINFGDDSSSWANDDECDDPRFTGDGMASSLIDDDRLHDATDCRDLFNSGSIQLANSAPSSSVINSIRPNPLANATNVDFGDNSSIWANNSECDDPRFAGRGMARFLIDSDIYHDADDCRALFSDGSIRRLSGDQLILGGRIERGNLRDGDAVRPNDSYLDTFTFIADRGNSAVIDLRSGDFDTYLIVRSPSGEEFINDDYESSVDRSLLSLSSLETGIYEVLVSSYGSGETGGYTVEIETGGSNSDSINQQIGGLLMEDDDTYSDGEYFDSYTFQGRPGQSVTIDLQSDEFDTYVILRSPNGEQESNDDFDSTNHSRIETQLSESGTYEVFVTSYAPGETGNYRLQISDQGTSSEAVMASRDVINLDIGDSVRGDLQTGDSLSDENEFQDSYIFSGNVGDVVTIDMTSTDFDTFLRLLTPSGETIENDDYEGSTDQSLLQLTLRESGRFRIMASSYSSSETGDYRLSIRSGGSSNGSNSASNNTAMSTEGGQIYGVFIGIADYPGEGNDLDLTDQDARRARDALLEGAGMNPDNAYTLIDSDATRANFQSALNSINATMGQDDTLVIFYSGHGSRILRPDGPDRSDPDGMDETIELYDGSLLDDELSDMLDNLNAGKILLVMDSCFSGGFAKDIVSAPGRMGLFSSEEDVTSQVAFKFQAGGYLSVFFDEAIRGGYADRDNNGELTALELSEYLHARYRSDVKSFGTDDYVRTSGPQSAYQHLVVDRGGIGPYNVLFTQQ